MVEVRSEQRTLIRTTVTTSRLLRGHAAEWQHSTVTRFLPIMKVHEAQYFLHADAQYMIHKHSCVNSSSDQTRRAHAHNQHLRKIPERE
jgi:hypothetical protein